MTFIISSKHKKIIAIQMLPQKTFYMIRHGETIANAENYTAGSLDVPLTEKGKEQAKEAREHVNALKHQPDMIFHSTLSRTKVTANILNQDIKCPMLQNPNLNEQDFGDWQGHKSWHDIQTLMKTGSMPPKGETLNTFYERAITGIKICLEHCSKIPLIVSHGGIFDAFWDFAQLPENDVGNCVLYEFRPLPSNHWDVIEPSK